MSVQRALSKSSLMALKASRKSCFKPVYCSELWLHVGSALQCSACNLYPSGRSNITETSAPTPWECGGQQGTAALHEWHLPEVPWGCQSLLLPQPPVGQCCPLLVSHACSPTVSLVTLPQQSQWCDCGVFPWELSAAAGHHLPCARFPTGFEPRPCLYGVWQSVPSQHTQLSNISITRRTQQQQFEQLPVGFVSFLQGTFCADLAAPRGTWAPAAPGHLHHLFPWFNSCTWACIFPLSAAGWLKIFSEIDGKKNNKGKKSRGRCRQWTPVCLAIRAC